MTVFAASTALSPCPRSGRDSRGRAMRRGSWCPPGDFAATNPFFLMADDRTDVGGEFGEAHPHAGIETVTFMRAAASRTSKAGLIRTMSSG